MKNTIGCAKHEEGTAAGQAVEFQRLAHELRQPLSSIECIGYYLDLVLGEQAPELHAQCETLRRLVQQAHWLLEDASLALSLHGAVCRPVSLSRLFTRLGAEMAHQDQRCLDLRIEGDAVVLAPLETAASFCGHALSFFHTVALAADPITVTAAIDGDLRLEIGAEVAGDVDELLRMVEPPRGGGLRAFVEAADGAMAARSNGRRLTLTFWLPRGE